MPYLGDYLGHILAEITIARMHADLEALRVAELYASHPLLRSMPVPRFRLPNVEIDAPVAIQRVEEEAEQEPARGTPTLAAMRSAFDRVLEDQIPGGIRRELELKRELKGALDGTLLSLSQPLEVAVDVGRAAREFAAVAANAMEASGKLDLDSSRQDLEARLQKAAHQEFMNLRKPIPRLDVRVTTGEIRDSGPIESVTRIKLRISEEGYEWASIESENGTTIDRLVVE
jgi:hypothetical protein